jgi:hypothetical protein
MDPDTTFAQFMQAVSDNDRETALARLSQLNDWLGRGGYRPKCPKSRVIPIGFIGFMESMLREST